MNEQASRSTSPSRACISKVRTIAAFSYKKSIGQPFVYPQNDLSYCANFLHMMFAVPAEPYEVDPEIVKALNLLLILHADHEQNCSHVDGAPGRQLAGEPVRRRSRPASARSGARCTAAPTRRCIEMLEAIQDDGGDVKKFVDLAKDKNSGFRLMGFGHRVYKNFDPRAKIIKDAADKVLEQAGHQRSAARHRQAARRGRAHGPLLRRAQALPERRLLQRHHLPRARHPDEHVHGACSRIGRLPGWIAHWKEMMEDPTTKIGRPRQIYTGPPQTRYVPIDQRK